MVEKTMSLAEPPPVFGDGAIAELLDLVEAYRERFGHDALARNCAGVLDAYIMFRVEHGTPRTTSPTSRA
ncbi:hypothetical protein [Xylanimonas allomyrinae]|uniref:hypothetical protein n=1 Tax=Xylanimonas allomyrinae TaxID=2509459 RepID=UPI0013A60154|nr:hypothetical protein [Xylanimonas allomyrinae]